MATPNRSIRLSDEAMEFIAGLSVVYGSPDKGILAIAAILTPEALAAHAESAELSKPEMVDSLKGVIENIETGVIQTPPPVIQAKARAESVAQRKARESKEHAAALAESDVVARMTGRDDIEYDLDNVPHRSVISGIAPRAYREGSERTHYEVRSEKVKPITRPHGSTEAKRRREQ